MPSTVPDNLRHRDALCRVSALGECTQSLRRRYRKGTRVRTPCVSCGHSARYIHISFTFTLQGEISRHRKTVVLTTTTNIFTFLRVALDLNARQDVTRFIQSDVFLAPEGDLPDSCLP